ncbi:sigma factor-like helix-turn-helix DNA-binding protein [Novosphingobium sp. JCM 18896]|uniref:sigma factor-like helix-turn-helix DNA-binding protein n=1 Tax=Novosphingobium sp. JCM 18896 TaxID=2989731 RepID=UPI002223422E|nr:sigma factor-like helix-turn-helix DNA-binding protein [Novosphingobium sp. JCM 18896]MCW1430831.1 hypothetical protein [Novosphingobium sp. JCM 18896]
MEHEVLRNLSGRQRQLLELVAEGCVKSKALANRTGIAAGTVDNQLQQAAKALGVVGRHAAAERYSALKENSHDPSHVRISPLPTPREITPSRKAGAVRRGLRRIGRFFLGPALGGEEFRLRWDQITLRIMWVAMVCLTTFLALVLFVLGIIKTFD